MGGDLDGLLNTWPKSDVRIWSGPTRRRHVIHFQNERILRNRLMSSETSTAPTTSKAMLWTGRIVTALPVLMLTMSAVMKLTKAAPLVEGFKKFGYAESLALPIGIVEVICTVLYLIPQTAVLGAILLTGYLGGATATHVRVEDNFAGPIIAGVLVWLGLFLRDARIRALIPFRR